MAERPDPADEGRGHRPRRRSCGAASGAIDRSSSTGPLARRRVTLSSPTRTGGSSARRRDRLRAVGWVGTIFVDPESPRPGSRPGDSPGPSRGSGGSRLPDPPADRLGLRPTAVRARGLQRPAVPPSVRGARIRHSERTRRGPAVRVRDMLAAIRLALDAEAMASIEARSSGRSPRPSQRRSPLGPAARFAASSSAGRGAAAPSWRLIRMTRSACSIGDAARRAPTGTFHRPAGAQCRGPRAYSVADGWVEVARRDADDPWRSRSTGAPRQSGATERRAWLSASLRRGDHPLRRRSRVASPPARSSRRYASAFVAPSASSVSIPPSNRHWTRIRQRRALDVVVLGLVPEIIS